MVGRANDRHIPGELPSLKGPSQPSAREVRPAINYFKQFSFFYSVLTLMNHNFFSINTNICGSFQCSKSILLCLITRMFKISLVSILEAMLPFTGSPLNWLRTERQRKERKNGNIGEYAIVHKLACSNWILWLCHVPSKLPQLPQSLLTKCISLRYYNSRIAKWWHSKSTDWTFD